MTQNPQDQIHFEAPSLEQVESLLPNYKFESFIAKGGMGAVYLATQISLDRPVAIKILPAEFGGDENFRESFQTEAKLMARLNHPNLIGVYDFGEIEGMLYIVMEYVPGKSLYEKAYGKAIKQELAIELIQQICEGLEHAHEVGILHRDIKPANILLKKKVPKIADFGLARPTGTSEAGGVIYGTPGYTAPEVLNNPDSVDQRADIYSVGVMLYELLAGHKPEGAYTSVDTHVECDRRLDKVIRKAINPNLRLRYASAKEMATELQDIARDLNAPQKSPLQAGVVQRRSNVSLSVPGTAVRKSGVQVKTAGAASAPAAKLATPSAPVSRPASTAKPPQVGQSGDGHMVRNVVIIIILLVAIYIAQDQLSKRKAKVAEINAQIELENKQRQKEKEAALAAQREKYQNHNRPTSSKPDRKEVVKPEPVKLGKLEQLSVLKRDLAAGKRPLEQMPEEVFFLNSKSRMLLYIETPMTWMEADAWCREHDAYLATVRSKADVAMIVGKIPSGKIAWLGAGKAGQNGWAWSDGLPYADELGFRKTSKLLYAGMGTDGYFELAPSSEMRPFVMEWRTDGSRPGSLMARMQTTKQSLNQIDPAYPPGTQTLGSRNFCILRGDVTFRKARELAHAAGGELFVPSDSVELAAVNDFIQQSLPEGELAWIGGKKADNHWKWVSGEPWESANWAKGYPKNNRLLAVTGKGTWRDVSDDKKLRYFLVEWSKDKAAFTPDELEKEGDAGGSSFAKLQEKARTLIEKENDSREAKHAENLKRLQWDIDFYYKGLSANDKEAQVAGLTKIKQLFDGKNRFPAEIEGMGPSQKVKGLTRYSYDKQLRIEKEFLSNIENIRTAYIGQLKKVKAELVQKGQISASREVEKEIKKVSRSNESFLSLFGIESEK